MTSEHTNRTHPMFAHTTQTNTINLGITTRCTMSCPNCSVDVPGIKAANRARDESVAQLLFAGQVLTKYGGFRRVHVTGGEPTMHKDFERLVPLLKAGFVAQHLTLETNGAYFARYKRLIHDHFDMVFITHYLKDKIYPGSPDNTKTIEEAQKLLGDRLIVEPPVEHPEGHVKLGVIGHRGDEAKAKAEAIACSKFYEPGLPCAYYEGILYPCCVSVGIDRVGLGVPVTENWRDFITEWPKGCSRCLYRGS
jgi:hypothetical protein